MARIIEQFSRVLSLYVFCGFAIISVIFFNDFAGVDNL